MNKELELLRFIETHLQQNKRVVLMVVVESKGSSPGRPGFKMAVAEDGILFGSIGGGVMEVNLVETAKEFLVMTDDEALKKYENSSVFGQEQVHRKKASNPIGMICSGKERIIFVKIRVSEVEKISLFSVSLTKSQKGIFEITDRGLWIITPEMENFENYQGNEDWVGTKEEFFEKYWTVIKRKRLFVSTGNDWGFSEKLERELYEQQRSEDTIE
jgi:xanthine dehydrogenase accessory factor